MFPLTKISTTDSKVFIFSGIANHSKFRNSVVEYGKKVIGELAFADHFNYSESSIRKIIQTSLALDTNTIITTEKDAVKFNHIQDERIWVVPMTLHIPDDLAEWLQSILQRPDPNRYTL